MARWLSFGPNPISKRSVIPDGRHPTKDVAGDRPHGRRTGTAGEWPLAARGSPPAPAIDEPGRGSPPRGRVRNRLCQSGWSKLTGNTASPANVSRSPPDARRTTLCPGVWPPVRVTTTPARDLVFLPERPQLALVLFQEPPGCPPKHVLYRRRHGGAGEIGRLPELGLGGRHVDPQVRTQPFPHPVDKQPAHVVHVHVGQHHVGHGRKIDAGGLQPLGQPPEPAGSRGTPRRAQRR